MNFKRNDVQEYIEIKLGCYDPTNWHTYKEKLCNLVLSEVDFIPLDRCITNDIYSYYFKAIQTFTQALHELNDKKYTWSIVKLYYTTFYLLRCEILLAKHIMVRCGGMYYLKLDFGATFLPFNKKKKNSDHQLTIALAEELYKKGEINDPIFGNQLDGESAYNWLMKQRERVNYRMKNFTDPYPDEILNHIETYFKSGEINKLFLFYNNDKDYSTCFDLDHAILSIPYKKLISIYQTLRDSFDFRYELKRKYISSCSLINHLSLDRETIKTFIK